MAATIEAICDALEAALDNIDGLRVRDIIPDSIPVSGSADVAIIMAPPIDDYRMSFGRGHYEFDVAVTVLVSAVIDRAGQRRLMAYSSQTGTKSIRAAVETDLTLGGVVEQAWLLNYRPLGIEEAAGFGYFGGVFTVHIVTTGT